MEKNCVGELTQWLHQRSMSKVFKFMTLEEQKIRMIIRLYFPITYLFHFNGKEMVDKH